MESNDMALHKMWQITKCIYIGISKFYNHKHLIKWNKFWHILAKFYLEEIIARNIKSLYLEDTLKNNNLKVKRIQICTIFNPKNVPNNNNATQDYNRQIHHLKNLSGTNLKNLIIFLWPLHASQLKYFVWLYLLLFSHALGS